MIHMSLKLHHIDKCNKNWRKVDVLTSILVRLSSSPPKHQGFKCFYSQIFFPYGFHLGEKKEYDSPLAIWVNLLQSNDTPLDL
jgi:hypothetical protein